MEKIKTLDWIRKTRIKNYEDFCDDPIGYEKRRKKREKSYEKKYGFKYAN